MNKCMNTNAYMQRSICSQFSDPLSMNGPKNDKVISMAAFS